jgi:dephospho-CoA kinase
VNAQTKAVIGLTGGIASGKSTVAHVLSSLGVIVIDADKLAREVVAKGEPALQEIAATFGADVLTPNGELDREHLGARVFAEPTARARLNAITHPRIAQLSAKRIAEALLTDVPYVVYEAPLLVETGAHRGLAALIVVATPPEIQIERVRQRDGLDMSAARARIQAQAPLEAKLAVADYVIDNDGSLPELLAKAKRVHEQILERFANTRVATQDTTD